MAVVIKAYTHVTTTEKYTGSSERENQVSPGRREGTTWELDLRTEPLQQELQGPQRGTLSMSAQVRALLGARAGGGWDKAGRETSRED